MLPSKTIADVITASDVTKPRKAVVKEWELGAVFMERAFWWKPSRRCNRGSTC
jgi:hypothetical protein